MRRSNPWSLAPESNAQTTGPKKKTDEGESESSRPVKVQLDGPEIQQNVMNSARNLRNAPDHLRQISICYDMMEDERKKTKSMVAQAQEKSESLISKFTSRLETTNLRKRFLRKSDWVAPTNYYVRASIGGGRATKKTMSYYSIQSGK